MKQCKLDNLNLYMSVDTLQIKSKSAIEFDSDKFPFVKPEIVRKSDNSFSYYRFNPDIPGWDNPGSFHSVDLWFWFETLAKCWRPFKGRHYDLARQMCNYITNFIKTGDPNGEDADETDMPEWRPYTSKDHAEMNFIREGSIPTTGNTPLVDYISDYIGKNM